jgi:hypothetical protein
MLQLSKEYRRISQERKGLIRRKHRLDLDRFEARQRTLSARQEAIRRARGIGQALGDSFAWVFYQHEPRLLEEHAKHESTDNLHDGIGGIGEREFVSGVPVVNGAMVLHHSTTTMLRVGDVSLVDLNSFRVKGIGELKTAPDGPNRLKVTMLAIGEDLGFTSDAPQRSLHTVADMASNRERDRLKRQLRRMVSMLDYRDAAGSDRSFEMKEDRRDGELAELLQGAPRDGFSYRQLDDGLLCVAYRRKPRDFVSTVTQPESIDFAGKMEGLGPPVQRLLVPGSPHNALGIGEFFYNVEGRPIHLLGTMPLFWSRIDLESLRQLFFHELVVITIFNPAHLTGKLEAKGFEVSTTSNGQELNVSLRVGNAQLHIAEMSYFVHLITHALFSENHVVRLLDQVTEVAKERAKIHGPHGRIDLRFNHALWHRQT